MQIAPFDEAFARFRSFLRSHGLPERSSSRRPRASSAKRAGGFSGSPQRIVDTSEMRRSSPKGDRSPS